MERNLTDALHLEGVAPYLSESHLTAAEMDRFADLAHLPASDQVTPELHERLAPLLGNRERHLREGEQPRGHVPASA